jgi:hypothetical protein
MAKDESEALFQLPEDLRKELMDCCGPGPVFIESRTRRPALTSRWRRPQTARSYVVRNLETGWFTR